MANVFQKSDNQRIIRGNDYKQRARGRIKKGGREGERETEVLVKLRDMHISFFPF